MRVKRKDGDGYMELPDINEADWESLPTLRGGLVDIIKEMEAEWAWLKENEYDLIHNPDGPGYEVANLAQDVDVPLVRSLRRVISDIFGMGEDPRAAVQDAMRRQKEENRDVDS